jgi:hypothetical protein
MKVLSGYMDQVSAEQETLHKPFDQNRPANKKGPEFQMLECSLAVLLRVYENTEVILHIRVDHIRAQQVSVEAPRYEALFRVIF